MFLFKLFSSKIGLVQRHGYLAEEHKLNTEDGYILTVHRIVGSKKSLPRFGKPIVYLQHGIFSSSDGWVLTEPERTLGNYLFVSSFI